MNRKLLTLSALLLALCLFSGYGSSVQPGNTDPAGSSTAAVQTSANPAVTTADPGIPSAPETLITLPVTVEGSVSDDFQRL